MSTQNAIDKPKPERKRGERPKLTRETALEIVKTSLDYAKGSGLPVNIGNHRGLCVITIGGGAFWNNDTQTLCVTPDDDALAHDTQPAMTHTA